MANKQAFNACPQDLCWLPVTVQGEACNRPCPSLADALRAPVPSVGLRRPFFPAHSRPSARPATAARKGLMRWIARAPPMFIAAALLFLIFSTTSRAQGVPDAPQDLTATSTAKRVELAWSAPANDGGSALLRYEVRSARGASVPEKQCLVRGNTQRTSGGPGRYDREVMADQFSVMPQNCRPSCSLAHAFTAVNSQVEREEIHLLSGPADDRPQFAEIGSCVPRRILLRHEHLPTPGGNCTRCYSVDPLWAGEGP